MSRDINPVYSSYVRHIIFCLISAIVYILPLILGDEDDIIPISVPGSDVCTRDHLARLEFVFLIDHSAEETIKEAPRIMKVIDDLQRTYEGSKFGITLYSDWECEAWQSRKLEGCYTFHEALSDDTELIKSRVQKGIIPHYPSGGQEAGVNGIMMTGADPRVGWTPGNEEIDVNKFILVFTDYKTFVDGNPQSTDGKPREPAKGDGTDKCSRMLGAPAQLTAKVLNRLGISVFVLLTTNEDHVTKSWKNAFTGMDTVKWEMTVLTKNNDDFLGKLKDFITDVAFSSPRVTCEDPPGYNTLGL